MHSNMAARARYRIGVFATSALTDGSVREHHNSLIPDYFLAGTATLIARVAEPGVLSLAGERAVR
jgi:hypothetical protein